MTANELRDKFINEFKTGPWPPLYYVDHETYANVCQYVFEATHQRVNNDTIELHLGINSGIMFNGVELILDYQK